jgi:hypothetical protein
MAVNKRGAVKRMVTESARDKRRRTGVGAPKKKFPTKELVADVSIENLLTISKREVVEAEQALRRNVREARRAGVSWQRIGDALGVTVQAAQKRYGPYPVNAPRVPRTPKTATLVARDVIPLRSK